MSRFEVYGTDEDARDLLARLAAPAGREAKPGGEAVSEDHENALKRAGLRVMFYVEPAAVVVYLGEEYARMAPAYDTTVVTHGRLKKLIARGVLNAEAALAAELDWLKWAHKHIDEANAALAAELELVRAERDTARMAIRHLLSDTCIIGARVEYELRAALSPAGEADLPLPTSLERLESVRAERDDARQLLRMRGNECVQMAAVLKDCGEEMMRRAALGPAGEWCRGCGQHKVAGDWLCEKCQSTAAPAGGAQEER